MDKNTLAELNELLPGGLPAGFMNKSYKEEDRYYRGPTKKLRKRREVLAFSESAFLLLPPIVEEIKHMILKSIVRLHCMMYICFIPFHFQIPLLASCIGFDEILQRLSWLSFP